MIDINKKYRTRDGREARIYALDGGGTRPVHGAIKDKEKWALCSWDKDGVRGCSEGFFDLIEVKPRIKRTVWLNLYPELSFFEGTNYPSKEAADRNAASNRISCVKVEIDVEEGEGL